MAGRVGLVEVDSQKRTVGCTVRPIVESLGMKPTITACRHRGPEQAHAQGFAEVMREAGIAQRVCVRWMGSELFLKAPQGNVARVSSRVDLSSVTIARFM